MSKYIKHSADFMSAAHSEYDEWLRQPVPNGAFALSKETTAMMYSTEKAILRFTATAYVKMQYLISKFDSEVAWHGSVERTAEDKSEFLITDILLYPQTVTGTTVNTDQAEYENWLFNLDDDTFNHMRFQGHSHVNMGVTPSPTDLNHQEMLLTQVTDDDYYVFAIWNKKNARTIMIYDKKRNLYFDSKDVEVEIRDDGSDFFDLIFTDDVVKERSATFGTGFYTGATATTAKPAATAQPKIQVVNNNGQVSKPTTAASATPATTSTPATGGVKRADGYTRGYQSVGALSNNGYPCGGYYVGQGWYADDFD